MTPRTHHSLIGRLRRLETLLRGLATLVLLAFAMQITAPAAAAVRQGDLTGHKNSIERPVSAAGELDALMQGLHDDLSRPSGNGLSGPLGTSGANPDTVLPDLRVLEALNAQIEAEFDAERQWITDKGLAHTLIARVDDAQATYTERYTRLHTLIQEAATQSGEAYTQALADLAAFLDAVQPQPLIENLDEMPAQVLSPVGRIDNPKALEVKETFLGVATTQKSFDNPDFLASRDEVQLTDAIRAQAAALNHNPVEIYIWVRNTIDWQPTWGGQQSAELTLQTRRGNAMDISTLLIALLRAADIPARYVHGVVEVPAERFTNWVGDFESVEAAADYASTGGIPLTTLTEGGRIAYVRIEHVWVEAAVDFYPARGALDNSNPDSWVALDASHKQYEYLDGLDALSISGIDPEQLLTDFENSGTVNETEGWVQGLDAGLIEQAQQQAEANLTAYIDQLTDPTVGDVIGGHKVIVKQAPVLPSGLPYEIVLPGNRYASLPNALRTRITLGLEPDILGDFRQQKTWPLYQLNQQRLTISFTAASADDQQAILAILPEELAEDPAQQPSSFMPSSIHVTPQIKHGNDVLMEGSPIGFGNELILGTKIQTPTRTYLEKRDSIIAGSYFALGVVGTNLAIESLQSINEDLVETKRVIDSGDGLRIIDLPRERVLGDLLVMGIHAYYAQLSGFSELGGVSNKTPTLLQPTIGTFGYEPNQRSIFGIVRGAEDYSVYMNVRYAAQIGVTQNDPERRIQAAIGVGMLSSSLEHSIPEQIFSDYSSSQPAQAVSAVKAIALARAQNQRIYHLSSKNMAELSNIHQRSETMSEIRHAVSSGKEVIVHAEPIEVSGWKGAGYVILDSSSGAGAYKIGGSKNGGVMGLLAGVAVGTEILLLFYSVGGPLSYTAALVQMIAFAAAALIMSFVIPFMLTLTAKHPERSGDVWKCFLAGFMLGLDLTLIFGALGLQSKVKTTIVSIIAAIDTIAFLPAPTPDDVTECIPGY